MIVYARDDIVHLSGVLNRNQWLTIKAAANLLLRENQEGIIVDCAELSDVSEEGAKTFLEALRDIQSAHARIIFCNLPENAQQHIKNVPGVRSQMPVAATLEEARASLKGGMAGQQTEAEGGVLVPLLDCILIEETIELAASAARDTRRPLVMVRPLEVARNLPLGAPMKEAEEAGGKILILASQVAKAQGAHFTCHLQRMRDTREGLLQEVRDHSAATVVLCASASQFENPALRALVDLMIDRAGCDVLVARKGPEPQASSAA